MSAKKRKFAKTHSEAIRTVASCISALVGITTLILIITHL